MGTTVESILMVWGIKESFEQWKMNEITIAPEKPVDTIIEELKSRMNNGV